MNYDRTGGPATKQRISNLPLDFEAAFTSDIHVGGIAFDDRAYQKDVLDWAMAKDNRYVFNLGDNVTGTHSGHPYYDHLDVPVHEKYDLHTIEGQADAFIAINRPLSDAGRLMQIVEGNHDWRFRSVLPVGSYLAKHLRVPYSSVSTLITIQHPESTLDFFLAHVGKVLPKGAKDVRQRLANQEAALQRNYEFHFDSADFLAHGHVHDCSLTKPMQQKFTVNVRDAAGAFHEVDVDYGEMVPRSLVARGLKYVHPYAKWYAVTGTFERTGVTTDVTDMDPELYAKVPATYAQRANYRPSKVAHIRMSVRDGRIADASVFVSRALG